MYRDLKFEYFHCNIGVRQGENLSPVLFSIFLNDFGRCISHSCNGLRDLSTSIQNHLSNDDVEVFFTLFTLLYADDTIVLAENENDMQNALTSVKNYCDTWKMTVNARKTKIVIFSRGKIRNKPTFTFGDDTLEIIDDYTYLGVAFNYNNKFTKAVNKQVNQARRSLYSLLSKTRNLLLPLDLQMHLFDQTVLPTLLYGCEIWGFGEFPQIEAFHLKYLKQTLKLAKSTPNCMIYGELGRHKLIKTIEVRMVNFWCELINSSGHKLSICSLKL